LASKLFLWISFLFFLSGPVVQGKEIPAFTSPVMDEANFLSSKEKAQLESYLNSLFAQGGSQIVVYTTTSLEQEDIAAYSIRVVDQWKLGTAKGDNGVLFLISKDDRKLRIEVGQGLEGVLVDAYAKRILDQVVSPYFKQGLFSQGIFAGVEAIVSYTDPEKALSPAPKAKRRQSSPLSLLFFLVIFVVVWVLGAFGGRRSRYGMLGAAAGWGSAGRGGFGGGGFGGGGFGGGGGGGFSGGGASGGW
jgi:uncharacterized protein